VRVTPGPEAQVKPERSPKPRLNLQGIRPGAWGSARTHVVVLVGQGLTKATLQHEAGAVEECCMLPLHACSTDCHLLLDCVMLRMRDATRSLTVAGPKGGGSP
jgi:hypothetical protein